MEPRPARGHAPRRGLPKNQSGRLPAVVYISNRRVGRRSDRYLRLRGRQARRVRAPDAHSRRDRHGADLGHRRRHDTHAARPSAVARRLVHGAGAALRPAIIAGRAIRLL